MDFNNLYDLLADGVDPALIAENFTKNLNDAITEYKEHQDDSNFKEACAELSAAWDKAIDTYMKNNYNSKEIAEMKPYMSLARYNAEDIAEALPTLINIVYRVSKNLNTDIKF